MKRQLALLDYALGALGRRRMRSISLAVGIAFVLALYASVLFVTDSLRREVRVTRGELPALTVQRLVAGRPALVDRTTADAIARIPAVKSARPRVWGYFFVPALSGNLTVVGVDTARPDVVRDLGRTVRGGRVLRPGGAASGEMLMGEALADMLGLRVGDELMLPTGGPERFLRLVGTFRSESALRTADVLLTSEADARALLSVPDGQATDVAVELTNPDEAKIVAEKIAELLPGARVIDEALLDRTYDLTFSARSGLLAAALLPALAALLLLAWDRLSGLGELERREIGVLKSIGWETRDVLTARMWESLVVSLGGAVPGLVLAYVWVFPLHAPGLAGVLYGWSAIYPPIVLVPAVSLEQLLALAALVVVPFVAVSIVPAWRAAMLDPDEAMRGLE